MSIHGQRKTNPEGQLRLHQAYPKLIIELQLALDRNLKKIDKYKRAAANLAALF